MSMWPAEENEEGYWTVTISIPGQGASTYHSPAEDEVYCVTYMERVAFYDFVHGERLRGKPRHPCERRNDAMYAVLSLEVLASRGEALLHKQPRRLQLVL